ncbi:sugar ABC transporter substrate-binding protein [Kribbella sp. NPDC005582]|uniref:ABC transporter substrate-binding protein n=1 Tax=Kribbella sp. NPDC005582 TaxID=3156893 RepID=UPI0033AED288
MKARKLRSAVALAAVAALALTGCGGSSSPATDAAGSSGPVELTFWSWVPKIDKAVALWNSTHPQIQVKLNAVPGGSQGTYTKMYAAVKAGNAPDIGQVEYSFLPNFAQLGDVQDISSHLSPGFKDQFPEWTRAQVSSGDAIFAVPQDIAPMGLFYRKDLFAQAGVTSPPATWEEFARAAELLHRKNPKQVITNFPTNQGDWFAGLAWQAGGSWFAQDGDKWKVDIDSPASRKVAEYWQSLVDKKLVKAEGNWSDQWSKELQDGTLAAWITGAWGGPSLESAAPATKGKWAVAPLPQWEAGRTETGNWGGSTNVVMKGSKHPAEAAQFIQWLNTDPASTALLSKESGLYPAATAWTSSAAYQAESPFFGGQQLSKVIGQQHLSPDFRWGPTSSDTFTVFQDVTGKLESGQGRIVDALSAAQTKTVATMKGQGFEIAGG